jgi:hypothetical protein
MLGRTLSSFFLGVASRPIRSEAAMVNKTGASRGVAQTFTDQVKGKSLESSRRKHFRKSEFPSPWKLLRRF